MSCCQCQGIERMFSGRYVRRDLKKYRRKGPNKTTAFLLKAIEAEGVEGAALLDIGGGVGAIQHELMKSGLSRAVAAEASSDFVAAAMEEAERQGHADRMTYHQGDFVELAPTLEGADVVTLDRVLCCYDDMASLVTHSMAKARRIYGLVYPRDVWWTKTGIFFSNLLLRLTRSSFRIFVHPAAAVDALVRGAGFRQRYYRQTLFWQVVVYAR